MNKNPFFKQNFDARVWWFALLVALAPTVCAQSTLLNGLVSRWDFEEGSGSIAADTSGVNHNDGTFASASGANTQWVQGKFGGGLAFTGQTSNRLIVPDNPSISADLANGFSVSAWFKSGVPLPAGSSTYSVLEKGNMFFLIQGVATGGMNFLLKKNAGNQTAGSVDPLEPDVWYHVTGVFDGAESRVYIDGQLKGSLAVSAPVDITTLDLVIGGDDGTRTFNGAIDQVLIWNRPLSEAEVVAVAAGSVPMASGTPVGIAISRQPESVTRHAGATARFSVTATGGSVRYVWYKDGEPLRSETASTMVIEHLNASDAGSYHVRVSTDSGEVVSDSVTLTVLPVESLNTARALYLPFDETSSQTASDASGSGNNGALIGFSGGSSQWAPGAVKGSLGFDGASSAVSVAHSPSLSDLGDEVSFAFWINPVSYGESESAGNYDRASSYPLRKGDHFGIRVINDPGTVVKTFTVRSAAGADNGAVARQGWEVNAPQNSLELNQWQHFAVIYRNGTITFYKNGFRIGEPVAGKLGTPDAAPLTLGDYDAFLTHPRFLNGRLDEVAVWARPISESEILELAGKDVAGSPAIVAQPVSQKRLEGTTVTFEVFVTGKRPLSYQWLRSGTELPGATTSTLTLSRLKTENGGEYAVRVTNGEGSTVSNLATLRIEALDAITSGLVAYYNFDDSGGSTLADSTDNHLDGSLKNMDASSHTTGQIGGAFQFDGIDDFIVVPHNDLFNLTTEATISVWLKIDGLSEGNDFDRVFRKTTTFDLVLINNGVVRLHGINKDPYSTPTDSWAVGSWTQYAYVVKNGTIQWYKNGEALGAPISGFLGELNTDPLVIGNFGPDLSISRLYMGYLDDMGIWQRALSPADIFGIYQNGLKGEPLNVEFEPLNIRSIASTGGSVEIRFYSPFEDRSLQVESKIGLGDANWRIEEQASIVDQGNGIHLATLARVGEVAFYRVAAPPPPPLFFDDFEQVVPGWTHGGNGDNWARGTPTTGPGSARSGSNVYGTGLSANVNAFSAEWLRTPEIDLTGVSSARLTFSEWLNIDPEVTFQNAAVSVLDAATLAPIQSDIYVASGNSGGWQDRSIRLAGDAGGRKVVIEFILFTDSFNLLEGWFIDDVLVRAE